MFKRKNKMLVDMKKDKMPTGEEIKQLITDLHREKELYESLNASLKEKVKEAEESLKKIHLIMAKLKPFTQ